MRSLNRHPAIPEPSWKYLVAASSKKDDVTLHSVYERPVDEVMRASDPGSQPQKTQQEHYYPRAIHDLDAIFVFSPKYRCEMTALEG
jgi:hypothetical protein